MKRIFAFFLCLFLFFPAGCGKKADPDSSDPENTDETPEPAIYLGESLPFPQGYSLIRTVTPRYDRENNTLTCLAQREGIGDDGAARTEIRLITLSAEPAPSDADADADAADPASSSGTSSPLSDVSVPLLSDGEAVAAGVLSDDLAVLLTVNWTGNDTRREYCLCTFRPSTGEAEKSGGLTEFFSLAPGDPFFALTSLALDGAGRIYAASENEIVCFGDGFLPAFSLASPDAVLSLHADQNGAVYALTNAGDGTRLVKIDPDRRAFSDSASLPLPARIAVFRFGEDHEAYYATDGGVWCADGLFDGESRAAQLLDYSSSRLYLATMLLALDGDTLLFSKTGPDGCAVPLLYRRAEDYEPGEKTVVELAHVGPLPMLYDQKILKYNAEHPDTLVVTRDYSDTAGDGDAKTAKTKLALDLATGRYRPDILVGFPNDAFIDLVVRDGLYADLGVYTKNDALVNDANLFGCVRRTLSDKDGRLWGLTRDYEIRSILSTAPLLGKYADQASWTVGDFLDYADSLPPDVYLMGYLAQDFAAETLFGAEGYGTFIDAENAGCDFTDPVFIRYLDFLKALPKTQEEAINLPQNPLKGMLREEQYQFYWTGGVALKSKWFHSLNQFLSLEIEFGTKDYRLIGRPTASGKQPITVHHFCVMTSFCENGEIAWDVIRTLIDQNDFETGGLPVLKSDFERTAKEYADSVFTFYFDGWETVGQKDPEHPLTSEQLDRPGIVTEFTEEDAAFIYDYLDNRCGAPYALSVDEEVAAIIQEEISAFLSGVGSAEDCAAKIQSRVSIWLAEHS